MLHWFQSTIDAFFAPSLPFNLRWRLLLLQPIALLTYCLKGLPWMFSNAFQVIRIPTRRPDESLRALVFQPNHKPRNGMLRPLHLDIHGGGFLGGLPEYEAGFCQKLSKETGAVVVSTQYRYSPRYTFPAAHEDIEDVSEWLVQNAERLWGADPKLLTVSGFSAGANLAFAMPQMGKGAFKWPSETAVKGCVTFYAVVCIPFLLETDERVQFPAENQEHALSLSLCSPTKCEQVDLRPTPGHKPQPPGFPKRDPLFFLYPLFDSYVTPSRPASLTNPILNPILAKHSDLPPNIFMVIATIDILLEEQLKFSARVKEEIEKEREEGVETPKRSIRTMVFEKCLHGWLERKCSSHCSFAVSSLSRSYKLIESAMSSPIHCYRREDQRKGIQICG
jgi:acetyl esterase/lipase